jgi:N utilization substance protein A
LLELEGMSRELAFVLASKGIVTREDLAEQAVDDLEEIEDLDPERAAELIMAARAHWFESEQQA